ncbi:MAG: F0F1 ATP synthase subunit epsilon [Ruminococcaceae bacterium]|nr:F0F1 ATP synthase subunit epsilon [Oscillospiraceae bacterium]
MNLFRLQITTPSGTVFEGEIARFSCRGELGDFAVMAGHVPFVTYVKEGICRITDGDGNVRAATSSGGLITVGKDVTHFLPTGFQFENE